MSQLEIQKFIKACNDIELANQLLWHQFKINSYKQPAYGTDKNTYVYMYKYSKKSPLKSKIADEANGLVLDANGNIVLRGFNRHNHILESPNVIDWETAIAMEKVPGKLIIAFNFLGYWSLATVNRVHGTDRLKADSKFPIATQASYYLEQMRRKSGTHCSGLYPFCMLTRDSSYIMSFEYDGEGQPEPGKAKLHLLGVYEKALGQYKEAREVDSLAHNFGFQRPRRYEVKNLTDINTHIQAGGNDGLIITDAKGNRVSAPRKKANSQQVGMSIRTRVTLNYLLTAALLGNKIEIPSNFIKLFSLILKTKADVLSKIRKDISQTNNMSVHDANRYLRNKYKGRIIEDAMESFFKQQANNASDVMKLMNPETFLKIIKVLHWEEFETGVKEADKESDGGELLYG